MDYSFSGAEYLCTLEEQIDPKVTALLVIDVQNDYVAPNGMCSKSGLDLTAAHEAIPRINRLIQEARNARVMVIWIRQTHSEKNALPNYQVRNIRAKVAPVFKGFALKEFLVKEGTWGADYYENVLKKLPDEVEVIKHTYTAFHDTALETYLKANGIKTIISIGFVSDGCVGSTAITGWFRGYYSIMPIDCSAAFRESAHICFLEMHETYYGYTPMSDEIISIWKKIYCP